LLDFGITSTPNLFETGQMAEKSIREDEGRDNMVLCPSQEEEQ